MEREKGLERFLEAQEEMYEIALKEIKEGRKRSHWIWFVFPQIEGLGYSFESRYYAIKDRKEAEEYMEHPVLGARLIEISKALLELRSNDPIDVMGCPDDLKLKSSMTLFYAVSKNEVFKKVLDKYFDREFDTFTLSALL